MSDSPLLGVLFKVLMRVGLLFSEEIRRIDRRGDRST